AQGRVQPTMQMKHGFAVNNDKGLESEADSMGQKATQAFSQNSNPEKKRQSNILIKTSRNNSVSQQIVQKKIVLDPVKGPFAERTLRDLEMLVGGGSVIVKSNGELAMIGLEQDALTAGWRLLERMILNPHTVVLGYDPNITGPKNKVGNLEDSRDPKKGSGSLVSIPLQVNMSDLVKTSTNELVMEDTERHIILAHELIHADRGQRGKKAKGAGLHDVIGIWKNEIFTKRGVFAVKEELETVGLLLAENDPEQITENMIRAQLGKNLRAAYDEKGLQLPGF
ncbi:MAG: hypothetical protein KDF49_02210, partial [Nitrosomonas sp.]|nr:hypothetical protein [Nitrosomonas sp.]